MPAIRRGQAGDLAAVAAIQAASPQAGQWNAAQWNGDSCLTHEFLGHMLGVRRVGVTKAAHALQGRKLIDYSRGKIRILDSRGLEAASCSCYGLVKDMHDGPPA